MLIPKCKVPGVYMIVNSISGKIYVGSAAKSLYQRGRNHRNELNRGEHPNIHLQRSWNKHGPSKFKFVVLEKCHEELCTIREQHWIDTFDSANPKKGFNICPNASSRLGTKMTEATKEKIRKTKVGKHLSVEARANMSIAQKSRAPHPEEAIQKMKANHWSRGPRAKEIAAAIAAARLGKKNSEESNRKNSETNKARMNAPDYVHPQKGVPMTPEMVEIVKKHHWSRKPGAEEVGRKISEARRKLAELN